LLVSNNAFDKPASGAKTLGLGTLYEGLQKCFRKPWGSNYPTEVISKMVFFVKMEDKEMVVLNMTLVITRRSLRTINPCNHITLVWDGA
jgi:hypothetical protein